MWFRIMTSVNHLESFGTARSGGGCATPFNGCIESILVLHQTLHKTNHSHMQYRESQYRW